MDATSGDGVLVRAEKSSTSRRCFAVMASGPWHVCSRVLQCCGGADASPLREVHDGTALFALAARPSSVPLGAGVQFPVGAGPSGRYIGVSVRGVSSKSSSNVPAQRSRSVKNPAIANIPRGNTNTNQDCGHGLLPHRTHIHMLLCCSSAGSNATLTRQIEQRFDGGWYRGFFKLGVVEWASWTLDDRALCNPGAHDHCGCTCSRSTKVKVLGASRLHGARRVVCWDPHWGRHVVKVSARIGDQKGNVNGWWGRCGGYMDGKRSRQECDAFAKFMSIIF